jgi:hypothetical protein
MSQVDSSLAAGAMRADLESLNPTDPQNPTKILILSKFFAN